MAFNKVRKHEGFMKKIDKMSELREKRADITRKLLTRLSSKFKKEKSRKKIESYIFEQRREMSKTLSGSLQPDRRGTLMDKNLRFICQTSREGQDRSADNLVGSEDKQGFDFFPGGHVAEKKQNQAIGSAVEVPNDKIKKKKTKKNNLALKLNNKKSSTSKNKKSCTRIDKILNSSRRRNSLRESSSSRMKIIKVRKNSSNSFQCTQGKFKGGKNRRSQGKDNSISQISKGYFFRTGRTKDPSDSGGSSKSKKDKKKITKFKKNRVSSVLVRRSARGFTHMKSANSSQDTLIMKKTQNSEKEFSKLKNENNRLKLKVTELKAELKQARKHLSNFLVAKNEEVDDLKSRLNEAIRDNTTMANQQSNLLKKFLEGQEELRKLKKLMMHYPSQKSIIHQSSKESSVVMMSNFLVDEIKKGESHTPQMDFTKEKIQEKIVEKIKDFEGVVESEIAQDLTNARLEYSSFIAEENEDSGDSEDSDVDVSELIDRVDICEINKNYG